MSPPEGGRPPRASAGRRRPSRSIGARNRRSGPPPGPHARGWNALALLLAAGCADGPPPEARPSGLPARRVREPALVAAWEVSSALQDTTLLEIGPLAADSAGVSIVDPMRHQVLRFDRSGKLLWAFGGRGAGPDEFLHPLDVRVDGSGRTWVLDDRNLRITVIGGDGRPIFRLPLGDLGGAPNAFVPLRGGRALVALLDDARPLVVLERSGEPAAREPFPWPRWARLDAIRGQFALASRAGSERWVAAFVFQDAFFGFEGVSPLGYRGWYVEPVPPPVVDEHATRRGRSQVRERTLVSAVPAARAATSSGGRLYVLFGGSSPRRGRIVDTYGAETGEYAESFVLPRPAARIAWGGGRLYATGVDPLPFLIALRAPDEALP